MLAAELLCSVVFMVPFGPRPRQQSRVYGMHMQGQRPKGKGELSLTALTYFPL